MSYYNTNNESGATLRKSKEKAKTQEQEILDYFRLRAKRKNGPMGYNDPRMAPSSVAARFNQYPITSIRRALSDLTKQGKLVKTDVMREGPYGKREHLWKLP